jgi:hypothetical protein
MTKKELIEKIKDYPDDMDLVFTQQTELEAGDIYDMYLDSVGESRKYGYINFHFRWTDIGE